MFFFGVILVNMSFFVFLFLFMLYVVGDGGKKVNFVVIFDVILFIVNNNFVKVNKNEKRKNFF